MIKYIKCENSYLWLALLKEKNDENENNCYRMEEVLMGEFILNNPSCYLWLSITTQVLVATAYSLPIYLPMF